MKIALYGGSFDPIHNGHLIVAERIKDKLSLDQVIFLPAAQNPLKKHPVIASDQDRVNMIQLAIQDNPAFEISEIEIKRGGNSYTIDTVREFSKKLSVNTQLFWIAGSDILDEIHLWKEFEQLKKMIQFVIVERPDFSQTLKNEKDFIYYHEVLTTLSSTFIRNALKDKKSVKYLVPESVEDYLLKNKLYQK